jgi:RNA polymerase sigma-70 factor (ECF subfamily)
MRRTVPSHTELSIAAGLRRRDPDAVRSLCTEYGPSARAQLRAAIADRTAVEDVFQQVLLEVWQRSPTFDPARASLRTWLATIVRSRAIDYLRRRTPEPLDPALVRTPAGESPGDPADRVAFNELLARLPSHEGTVIWLHFHMGLSQRQIAEHTGAPLGTVKSRTASALQRLRGMLDEERAPAL